MGNTSNVEEVATEIDVQLRKALYVLVQFPRCLSSQTKTSRFEVVATALEKCGLWSRSCKVQPIDVSVSTSPALA